MNKLIKAAIEKIMDAGLSIVEHENNSIVKGFAAVNHLTIIGGVRRVEFYPTNGTVYANSVKDEFKQVSVKKSNVETAIKVAMFGR